MLAAREAGMPVVILFTVEMDGRLPSGEPLGEAIEAVDSATDGYAAYYGINCAHPTHFDESLLAEIPAKWLERLRALRCNASAKSHAELDEATELDDGNPEELGEQCRRLRDRLPWLNVLGGVAAPTTATSRRSRRRWALAGQPQLAGGLRPLRRRVPDCVLGHAPSPGRGRSARRRSSADAHETSPSRA